MKFEDLPPGYSFEVRELSKGSYGYNVFFYRKRPLRFPKKTWIGGSGITSPSVTSAIEKAQQMCIEHYLQKVKP